MIIMKRITCEVTAGDSIAETCESAVLMANHYDCVIIFTFNGITMMVDPRICDARDLADGYARALHARDRMKHDRGPIHAS